MMEILTEKTEQEFLEAAARLRKAFEEGDAKAGYALSCYIDPQNEVVPLPWRQRIGTSEQEYRRVIVEVFGLLEEAAANGDGESMHLVGQFYQSGTPPVLHDMELFRVWCERAVAAGYTFAANDLFSIYSNSTSRFFDPDKARSCLEMLKAADLLFVPITAS